MRRITILIILVLSVLPKVLAQESLDISPFFSHDFFEKNGVTTLTVKGEKLKDTGIGMSSEFLEKIFIPFERVRNTTISKIEGTGLGMAIVKNLVEQMGGTITAQYKGDRLYIQIVFPECQKNG